MPHGDDPEWLEDGKTKRATETTPLKGSKNKKNEDDNDEVPVVTEKPMPNTCLVIFHLLSAVAAIGLVAMMLTQVVPLFFSKDLSILQYTLRLYVTLFCGVFLIAECNFPIAFIRKSALLQNFISRGFLYSFVALVGMEEGLAVRVEDAMDRHGTLSDELRAYWASILISASSWILVVVGVMYALLGVCFLQVVKENLVEQHALKKKGYELYQRELKRFGGGEK